MPSGWLCIMVFSESTELSQKHLYMAIVKVKLTYLQFIGSGDMVVCV